MSLLRVRQARRHRVGIGRFVSGRIVRVVEDEVAWLYEEIEYVDVDESAPLFGMATDAWLTGTFRAAIERDGQREDACGLPWDEAVAWAAERAPRIAVRLADPARRSRSVWSRWRGFVIGPSPRWGLYGDGARWMSVGRTVGKATRQSIGTSRFSSNTRRTDSRRPSGTLPRP